MDGGLARTQNRAAFPLAAEAVDAFRAVFGPQVRLLWASEGGQEIGQRGAPGIPVVVGPSIEDIKKRLPRGA